MCDGNNMNLEDIEITTTEIKSPFGKLKVKEGWMSKALPRYEGDFLEIPNYEDWDFSNYCFCSPDAVFPSDLIVQEDVKLVEWDGFLLRAVAYMGE